jgi:hypothetical protein
MTMLDDILADLINDAVSTREGSSIEELELRDNVEIHRFFDSCVTCG